MAFLRRRQSLCLGRAARLAGWILRQARLRARNHADIFEICDGHRIFAAYLSLLLARHCRRNNCDSRRFLLSALERKPNYFHGTPLRRGHIVANQVVLPVGTDTLPRTRLSQRYLTRIAPTVVSGPEIRRRPQDRKTYYREQRNVAVLPRGYGLDPGRGEYE